MAIFSYQALDQKGSKKRGTIEADSLRTAKQRLKAQKLFPIDVKEEVISSAPTKSTSTFAVPRKIKTRVSSTQLAVATRQLATLINAGMPVVESLRALGEQTDSENLRKIIADISDSVNEGSSLANALKKHSGVFPKLYINMVASGEASGTIDAVLNRLADLLENQNALRRKITSALTYPALMLGLCFLVIIFLLTYVVPQITQIFSRQGTILPAPTRFVIGLSDFLRDYYFVLVPLLIIAVLGFSRYKRTERGRFKIDSLKLKLPAVGPILLKVASARFAGSLGAMLTSGIDLIAALLIAKNVVGNTVLEEAVDRAAQGVKEGSSLSAELNKSQLFPRLLTRMIAIGEKTGTLDQLCLRAAASYEGEVNAVIAGLTALLEPLLIIFLAAVVGGILAAVMLPMLEMSSLAGK